MAAKTILLILPFLLAGCGTSPSGPGSSQTPTLISPANGDSVVGPQVTCTWDAVTGATKYYHQIDSDPTMQSPSETVTTNPAVVVTPGQTGNWWWRVRASVSGQSTYTPWSEVFRFTLQ